MCWGQFAVPPAAPTSYNAQLKAAAGSPDSQQLSSATPDGSDYLDETLLGHINDDALLENWDGELDMLDTLLKEEVTSEGNAGAEISILPAPTAEATNDQTQAEVAGDNQVTTGVPFGPFCYRNKAASDGGSDQSVQTPARSEQTQADQQVVQVVGKKEGKAETAAVPAQSANQVATGQAVGGVQAQLAAQQMAAAAAAAQMQLQLNGQIGMLPNMAAMQMLASNPACMMGAAGFPFSNQMMMQPSFGFKVGVSNKPANETDEAVERIKKKRRESAQRSRARKNQYMKALELENKGLRAENCKLREYLMVYERQSGLKMPNIPITPIAVRPLPESFMHHISD